MPLRAEGRAGVKGSAAAKGCHGAEKVGGGASAPATPSLCPDDSSEQTAGGDTLLCPAPTTPTPRRNPPVLGLVTAQG